MVVNFRALADIHEDWNKNGGIALQAAAMPIGVSSQKRREPAPSGAAGSN